MSKKLESILSRVPPATVEKNKYREEKEIFSEKTKYTRIVAVVPVEVKRQIKMYLAENPGDTEKTVILKALQAFGFKVPQEEIKDQRGRGEQK